MLNADVRSVWQEGVLTMKRIETRVFALLLGLLAVVTFQGCQAQENPLIGTWRWDGNRTLIHMEVPEGASDELKKSAQKARLFVERTTTKLRSNVALTYREHECDQIMFAEDGQVLSRETFPYKIVEVRKDVVVLDQFENGGLVKLFREDDQSIYVEVHVGDYTYKDYFTKER